MTEIYVQGDLLIERVKDVEPSGTIMPPPPGSRRTDVQRSLCLGTTRPTAVDTSIAGFMVKVMMVISGAVGLCRERSL